MDGLKFRMVLKCLFVVNECYYMSGVMMAMHDGNAIDNKDGGATSVLMQVAHREKRE